jgi:hypothetical protein
LGYSLLLPQAIFYQVKQRAVQQGGPLVSSGRAAAWSTKIHVYSSLENYFYLLTRSISTFTHKLCGKCQTGYHAQGFPFPCSFVVFIVVKGFLKKNPYPQELEIPAYNARFCSEWSAASLLPIQLYIFLHTLANHTVDMRKL